MQHLTWLICYKAQKSQCGIDCRNVQYLPLTKASTCCLTCSLTQFFWTVQAMSRIPLNRNRVEGELAQRLVALLLLAMLPLRPRQRLCSPYRSRLCKPFHRHPDSHTHTWMVCCLDACEFWAVSEVLAAMSAPATGLFVCLSVLKPCKATALSRTDGAGSARQDAVSQHQVCLLQHMCQLAPGPVMHILCREGKRAAGTALPPDACVCLVRPPAPAFLPACPVVWGQLAGLLPPMRLRYEI